jgi:hypothetical protein
LYFHSITSFTACTISTESPGLINLIFHETTSGIAEVLLVIKIFHIATLSVCTDPNHSDIDGAMTQSQLATINLNCSLVTPLKSCTFSQTNLFICFKIFELLFESIILKTNFTLFSFTNSGNACTR